MNIVKTCPRAAQGIAALALSNDVSRKYRKTENSSMGGRHIKRKKMKMIRRSKNYSRTLSSFKCEVFL